MILNDIAVDDETIEYSDTWTEQDLKDLTEFALSQERPWYDNSRATIDQTTSAKLLRVRANHQ